MSAADERTVVFIHQWRETKPSGSCTRCGHKILLRAMQLHLSISINGGRMETYPTALFLCCACHDRIET